MNIARDPCIIYTRYAKIITYPKIQKLDIKGRDGHHSYGTGQRIPVLKVIYLPVKFRCDNLLTFFLCYLTLFLPAWRCSSPNIFLGSKAVWQFTSEWDADMEGCDPVDRFSTVHLWVRCLIVPVNATLVLLRFIVNTLSLSLSCLLYTSRCV